MDTSSRAWCCAVLLLLGLPQSAHAQDDPFDPVARGQKLFARVWTPERDAPRDGLGPLFNERSCVACHFLGGVGGAGPNDKNVDVLTASIPAGRIPLTASPARLVKLHRGFSAGTTIVLHRFGTDPRYAAFRNDLLGVDPALKATPSAPPQSWPAGSPVRTINADGAKLLVSTRNTTPLFGLGLIESIPVREIKAVAALQARENPKITGRFVGRFGWRGQTNTLADFIRGACAVELGLQVATHAQAIDPLPGAAQPISRKTVDLTEAECHDLTAFVADLPAPRRIKATSSEQALELYGGEQLFHAVGCAACHRPALGEVNGIYSDLLVHDMGQALADPSPGPPIEDDKPKLVSTGYYGPAFETPGTSGAEKRREWKTPPLWGLKDSAPYLHDGRARTVAAAITDHAGEAADSVRRYQSLPQPHQARLQKFLATLAAPAPN